MPFASLLALVLTAGGAPGTSVTPVDAAAESVVGYVLNYGLLGVLVLAFVFRVVVPYWVLAKTREEARADLLEENKRLREEKHHAEEQRDDVEKMARDELVPLLTQFVATTSNLIPILQRLITEQDIGRGHRN